VLSPQRKQQLYRNGSGDYNELQMIQYSQQQRRMTTTDNVKNIQQVSNGKLNGLKSSYIHDIIKKELSQKQQLKSPPTGLSN